MHSSVGDGGWNRSCIHTDTTMVCCLFLSRTHFFKCTIQFTHWNMTWKQSKHFNCWSLKPLCVSWEKIRPHTVFTMNTDTDDRLMRATQRILTLIWTSVYECTHLKNNKRGCVHDASLEAFHLTRIWRCAHIMSVWHWYVNLPCIYLKWGKKNSFSSLTYFFI